MLDYFLEITVAGVLLVTGYASKSFLAKRKFKKNLPDNVYPYTSAQNYTCPQCDFVWLDQSLKYCECDEFYSGHFHPECWGPALKRDSKNKQILVGCKYKWIMLSKYSSK